MHSVNLQFCIGILKKEPSVEMIVVYRFHQSSQSSIAYPRNVEHLAVFSLFITEIGSTLFIAGRDASKYDIQ